MKPTYVVTEGITNLLTTRYGLDLSDKATQRIDRLEQQFTEGFGALLKSHFRYEVVSAKTIEEKTKEQLESNSFPLICLDDVYFQNIPRAGEIAITRLIPDVNQFGDMNMGPRRGFPSLQEQYSELGRRLKGQQVSLLDVGTFHGDTLLQEPYGVISRLRQEGVEVTGLYAAIVNETGKQNLEQAGIDVHAGIEFDLEDSRIKEKGDWLESRDLLVFDGRKIDSQSYAVQKELHLFGRYTENEDTLNDGASIRDKDLAGVVIAFCNMYHEKIVRELVDDNFTVLEGFVDSDKRIYALQILETKLQLASGF